MGDNYVSHWLESNRAATRENKRIEFAKMLNAAVMHSQSTTHAENGPDCLSSYKWCEVVEILIGDSEYIEKNVFMHI